MSVEAVLARLIDIYMVTFHPNQELFSVNAIDQDYALSQLPETGVYGKQSLNDRAAEYYSHLQIAKESWQALSDVEPYMLAVEHLCAAENFEKAAETLGRINPNFVAVRGNPQALAELYERVDFAAAASTDTATASE